MEKGIELIAPLSRERGTFIEAIYHGFYFSEFSYRVRINHKLRIVPLGIAVEAYTNTGIALAGIARTNLSLHELGIIGDPQRAYLRGGLNRLIMERKLAEAWDKSALHVRPCLTRLTSVEMGYCVSEPKWVPEDLLRKHELSVTLSMTEVCDRMQALLENLAANRSLAQGLTPLVVI